MTPILLDLALKAGFSDPIEGWMGEAYEERLEAFAKLIIESERKVLMQLFTDPENQPTQYGTVTIEYMRCEMAAEREECAELVYNSPPSDEYESPLKAVYDAIRARGQA
jgi:hypothetical protein